MRTDAKVYILTHTSTKSVKAVDASLAHLMREIEASSEKEDMPARLDILAMLRVGMPVTFERDGEEFTFTSTDLGMLHA